MWKYAGRAQFALVAEKIDFLGLGPAIEGNRTPAFLIFPGRENGEHAV